MEFACPAVDPEDSSDKAEKDDPDDSIRLQRGLLFIWLQWFYFFKMALFLFNLVFDQNWDDVFIWFDILFLIFCYIEEVVDILFPFDIGQPYLIHRRLLFLKVWFSGFHPHIFPHFDPFRSAFKTGLFLLCSWSFVTNWNLNYLLKRTIFIWVLTLNISSILRFSSFWHDLTLMRICFSELFALFMSRFNMSRWRFLSLGVMR